jgi:hypothetical protein
MPFLLKVRRNERTVSVLVDRALREALEWPPFRDSLHERALVTRPRDSVTPNPFTQPRYRASPDPQSIAYNRLSSAG